MWWRVIKLSVLVCGIPERLPRDRRFKDEPTCVLNDLIDQSDDKPVEVLYLLDNLKMSVGRKRNILLSIAQGEYVAYCDDDDEVAPDYVATLLDAIGRNHGVDVIVFGQDCIRGDRGGVTESCQYGLAFEYANGVNADGHMWWRGLPSHTMCWRTDLVQGIAFPDETFGEDVAWCRLASAEAKTEVRLNKTLYTYRYNPKTSRTRG